MRKFNKRLHGNYATGMATSFNRKVNRSGYYIDPLIETMILNKLSSHPSPSVIRSNSVSYVIDAPTGSKEYNSLNRQTIYFDYSPIFAYIKDILEDKTKTTEEKQLDIEKFMLKTWIELTDIKKTSMQEGKVVSESFKLIKEYINDYNDTLIEALDKLTVRRLSQEKKAVYNILYELDKLDISATVLNSIIPIISSPEGVKYNEFIIKLGETIHRLWLNTKYEEYKKREMKEHNNLLKNNKDLEKEFKNHDFIPFKDFIADKQIGKDSCGIIGEFLTYNFLNLDGIIDKKLVNTKNTNKEEAVLIPHPDTIKVFENAFNVIGIKLPMVHKPVKWSTHQYGGYLLNKEKYSDELIHKNNMSGGITLLNNKIYEQVNFMSSVGYKINADIYDFIAEYGIKNKLILESLHKNTDNMKDLSDKDKNEVISHNSRYYHERNIIGLATLYKEVERFYLPLYFDWRGRIYNDITYLNYQSIPLAKALLMFEKGDEINPDDITLWKNYINKTTRGDLPNDNFFYWLSVYGANCFGSGSLTFKEKTYVYKYKTGLDKISFEDRVRWVIDHHKQIMSMKESFWGHASEPLLFVSFCMEYRKIFNGLTNKTCLPIQLDASCNGIQHLSIMSANSNLAKLVNLMPSDYKDSPYDLYSIVLTEINKKLTELVKKEPKHILLKSLKLDRKLVKRSIMTIPYNVTVHGVVNHLEEFFNSEWKDRNLLYKPKDIKNGNKYITQSDMFKLATIIRSTLFDMHPELNGLINYYKEMVDLFNKLNLPIVWKTPSGLEIKQKYVKCASARIRSGYYRGSTFNLLIPTDIISKTTQKNSFMPNLIHSMDAANITQLISRLKSDAIHNIYTIHDCFATTACNIPQLNILVRESFISLYAETSFVKSLHKFFLEYIVGSFVVKHISRVEYEEKINIFNRGSCPELNNILEDDFEVIIDEANSLTIPSLPKLDEFTNLRDDIRKAVYKIN